jgi:hypothetical protein
MAPKGVGVSEFGAHGFGRCDCNETGPFGSYEWSASGDELTLKAKKEGCPNRRAILEGIWTRAHRARAAADREGCLEGASRQVDAVRRQLGHAVRHDRPREVDRLSSRSTER